MIPLPIMSNHGHSDSGSSSTGRPIRCLQWNIERNYKPEEILATLTELDADILCIQEVDIGCHRSGYDRDHFLEMCQSQGLHGGFVPEFWELEHPGRRDRDQGGGVHGNAILSKWPINGFRVLDHVHHAYEWEKDGLKLNEPRLGRRFTIVADIQTPSGPLLCYSAHLEVFTGVVGRISALSDILADSELYSDRYPHQILFGDLNTISHSVARLAKTISTDQYRIGSIGEQEAEWWDRNLFSWHVQDGEFNLALASGGWSWLRLLGIFGLGTSYHEDESKDQGSATFWSADSKYNQWLKRLVGSGLQKIKQARQFQLLTDTFITLEGDHPLQQGHDDHKDMCDDDAVGELESEENYQEEGSVILVQRRRTPSIIKLETNLMERSEYMSTTDWSSLAAIDEVLDDSDNDEYEKQVEQRGRKLSRGNSVAARTPSTPSPTLRLIPPTPTKTRGMELPDVTELERGIPVDCDDDVYGDNDFEHQSYHHQHYHHHPHYDSSTFESQHKYARTFNTETTTTTTTTTTLRYRNCSNNQDINDGFHEPQPPFSLSDLKLTHPLLATKRLWSGFTPLVLHQARNPGFYDPWSVSNDMTFHNPNFLGLLKAKLDFTLLMNLKCVGRTVGNHDYSASDHKWLLVEVEFEREFKTTATTRTESQINKEENGIQREEETKDNSALLPSKEQRYLWWRERRLESRQHVQPLSPSLSSSSSSSSSSSLFSTITLAAIMAIGGALWWSLQK
ncbi:hypothetical protein BGZ65_000246 [Modicella reniformis]|uniref:Endonuclease/exonuclease/phosphatase domain-containing protein n=1 Tax=Modicella reniformis TaxID=1440133 RepID=A0A9P6MK80_9FUNG|nr:hypothetical protein BGZ65_000246 [Modicella reniformis]